MCNVLQEVVPTMFLFVSETIQLILVDAKQSESSKAHAYARRGRDHGRVTILIFYGVQ